MPAKLKTDWKRIGRSGATADGRTIEPEALREAAQSYDPELFTALMWPEHFRWYNLGKITELRAEDNNEGGVDLFARIAPNDYYLEAVKFGQKLFTSMELLPNFRNTGKVYLTGCAATDNPASAATSEMRFTASKEPDLSLGEHIEFTTQAFDDDEADEKQLFRRFADFFKQNTNEADMSNKAIEQLRTELTTLTEKFTAALADKTLGSEPAEAAAAEAEDFTALSASVTALADKFTKLEAKFENSTDEDEEDDGEGNANDLKFAALQTALDELTQKFNAALEEESGTAADENTGGNDLEQYI